MAINGLTIEEKRERKKQLGASDVAAILGVDSFRSAWDVAADKTDLVEDWDGNEVTKLGHAFEQAVLDVAEEELGALRRNVRIIHPTLPVASTLDAECFLSKRPVEAKTSGLLGPIYGDWGDSRTDEVPETYLCQVHTQLLCTGSDLAYLFALLPGRGVVQYEIERNEKVCEHLGNVLAEWWQRHIVEGVEPSRERASLEVVKRMRKTPNKIVELDDETCACIALHASLTATMKEDKELKDEYTKHILLALGDAEQGMLPDGSSITYFETPRAGYEVKPTKYRTLRIKKAKR